MLETEEKELAHRCDDTSGLPNIKTCQPANTSNALARFTKKWDLSNVNFDGEEEFQCSRLVSAKAKLGDGFKILVEDDQVKITYKDSKNTVNYWPLEDACLNFLESKKTPGKIYPSLAVCDSRPQVSRIKIVYPVMILLSSLFMFLTLLVYILLKDMREPLSGKMVVGFLINVTLNFVSNGINRVLPFIENSFLNTPLCIFLAYFTHYTFISFFMWMNAMAINMTYSFKSLKKPRGTVSKVKMFLIVLYTQGLPALLGIVIAVLDNHGDCSRDKDDLILPNIARHNCFLKTQYYNNELKDIPEHQHFWIKLRSAEFLYFYMIVMIIVIFNTVCFIITGFHICRHFKDTNAVAQRTKKEQAKMAITISTIMGKIKNNEHY